MKHSRDVWIYIALFVFGFALLVGSVNAQQSQIGIDVKINEFDVEDGDTLEIGDSAYANISVSSSQVIDHIVITTNNKQYARGLELKNFSMNRSLDVAPGTNEFSVKVVTRNGSMKTHRASLHWNPETLEEVRWTMNRLETELGELQRENQRLEDRFDNLSQRNQVLLSTNQELKTKLEEQDGVIPGLPGFTFFAAVASLLSVLLIARKYKK